MNQTGNTTVNNKGTWPLITAPSTVKAFDLAQQIKIISTFTSYFHTSKFNYSRTRGKGIKNKTIVNLFWQLISIRINDSFLVIIKLSVLVVSRYFARRNTCFRFSADSIKKTAVFMALNCITCFTKNVKYVRKWQLFCVQSILSYLTSSKAMPVFNMQGSNPTILVLQVSNIAN